MEREVLSPLPVPVPGQSDDSGSSYKESSSSSAGGGNSSSSPTDTPTEEEEEESQLGGKRKRKIRREKKRRLKKKKKKKKEEEEEEKFERIPPLQLQLQREELVDWKGLLAHLVGERLRDSLRLSLMAAFPLDLLRAAVAAAGAANLPTAATTASTPPHFDDIPLKSSPSPSSSRSAAVAAASSPSANHSIRKLKKSDGALHDVDDAEDDGEDDEDVDMSLSEIDDDLPAGMASSSTTPPRKSVNFNDATTTTTSLSKTSITSSPKTTKKKGKGNLHKKKNDQLPPNSLQFASLISSQKNEDIPPNGNFLAGLWPGSFQTSTEGNFENSYFLGSGDCNLTNNYDEEEEGEGQVNNSIISSSFSRQLKLSRTLLLNTGKSKKNKKKFAKVHERNQVGGGGKVKEGKLEGALENLRECIGMERRRIGRLVNLPPPPARRKYDVEGDPLLNETLDSDDDILLDLKGQDEEEEEKDTILENMLIKIFHSLKGFNPPPRKHKLKRRRTRKEALGGAGRLRSLVATVSEGKSGPSSAMYDNHTAFGFGPSAVVKGEPVPENQSEGDQWEEDEDALTNSSLRSSGMQQTLHSQTFMGQSQSSLEDFLDNSQTQHEPNSLKPPEIAFSPSRRVSYAQQKFQAHTAEPSSDYESGHFQFKHRMVLSLPALWKVSNELDDLRNFEDVLENSRMRMALLQPVNLNRIDGDVEGDEEEE